MLRVRMRFPELRPADYGSSVHAELRDTSIADALHPTVAEAWAHVSPDIHEIELTIDVVEGRLAPGHRYSLWAHVGQGSAGHLRRGDLITAVDIPVTADDVAASAVLAVPLTRI
jgi:hypothetical protein